MNPSEMIAFAVIHHYTAYQGGYAGGALALAKWCGIAKSNIYHVIETLIGKQLIVKLKASKGRGTSVYASIVNCPKTGQLEGTEQDSYLSQNRTVNCPKTGHYIDNRYIDNPPVSPLGGDSAGRPQRPRRRTRSQERATNIISNPGVIEAAERIVRESSAEFYQDSLNELRIE